MKKVLSKVGYGVKSVGQLRSAPESCLLSAETKPGDKFFMKATPPRAFNEEVMLSCALAETIPGPFPKPLFADKENRWMIMNYYGNTLSDEHCSVKSIPDLVQKVLLDWVEIQKKSISIAEELGKLGVPVYDGNGYKERVEEMLNDPEYVEAQWEGMTEKEKGKYGKEGYRREFLAFVEHLWGRISEYNVPLTPVHGDLDAVNLIPDGNGSFKFIDLAHVCISFPFLDASSFMSTCGEGNDNLDFYLSQWTEFENVKRLKELLDLVEDLSYVENCILSYHFYRKAEERRRCSARTELKNPLCSLFSKYLSGT